MLRLPPPAHPSTPPGVIVGHCTHTCITSINLGVRNPIKIRMRSHYTNSPTSSCRLHATHIFFQCPICKYSFKHNHHPHDKNTRTFLREVLDQYNAEKKCLKAQLKAQLKATRRAIDQPNVEWEGDKAKVCFFLIAYPCPSLSLQGPVPLLYRSGKAEKRLPSLNKIKSAHPLSIPFGAPC
jgi:hypothetical protein